MAFFRLALVILLLSLIGCQGPNLAGMPRIVRARDLAADHITDRAAARIAYHGQTLQVCVGLYVVSGHDVLYFVRFDGQDRKPVIIFHFDGEPKCPEGTVWIEGICEGCVDDTHDRGIPGYTFTITLVHCKLIPPPAVR